MGNDSGIFEACVEDPSAYTEGTMTDIIQEITIMNNASLRYLSLIIRSPVNRELKYFAQSETPKNLSAFCVVISQICSSVVPRISAMAFAVYTRLAELFTFPLKGSGER